MRVLLTAAVIAVTACTAPPSATELPAEPPAPTAGEPVAIAASVRPARVARGGEATLAVRFVTAASWHVYPAEAASGMATRLVLADAPGVQAGAWVFPPARPMPDDPTLVLEGDFAVTCPLRIDADAPAGTHRLRVTVDYVACDPLRCNPVAQRTVEAELEVR